MLTILFGIPGVGKSFIGKLLADQYGFYFYEADNDLTPSMIKAVQSGTIFTEAMRDEFFNIVIDRMSALKQKYPKVVMAQAMAKEKNRLQILKHFPEAQFFWVEASPVVIEQRLSVRADWVSFAYAEKVRKIFDIPKIPHVLLNNNQDVKQIKRQFSINMNSNSLITLKENPSPYGLTEHAG